MESVVGRSYAKVLIHNLRRRGQIAELVRGVYTSKGSPYIIVKAIPMAYVGLGSAAFLHGAWNQVTAVTVLTPLVSEAVRGGVREVAGFKVILRRISRRMYFGYEYEYLDELGEWIRVSDPEKTLIDLIYMRHPARGEIIPRMLEAGIVEASKLARYVRVMRERGVRGWRRVEGEIAQLTC